MKDWLKTVHAYCMESGVGLTSAEAVAKFGDPPSGARATNQMQHGRTRGLFVVKETGRGNQHRYFAQPIPQNHGGRRFSPSFFDGDPSLRSARSVFELGRDA